MRINKDTKLNRSVDNIIDVSIKSSIFDNYIKFTNNPTKPGEIFIENDVLYILDENLNKVQLDDLYFSTKANVNLYHDDPRYYIADDGVYR